MGHPTIVKLGGSVITHKDSSPPQVNGEAIIRVAKELEGQSKNVIIVLGGGAHGHQAAHEYGFDISSTSPNRLLEGVPKIRHNMTELSTAVANLFCKQGIQSVVVPPFASVSMNDNEIENFPTVIFRYALEAGLTIITHGDVCFDRSLGASILSGDAIVAHLAKSLDSKSVLIGTDVDGVYDCDPRDNPNATLVTIINQQNKEAIIKAAGPSRTTDVTGGMSRKIDELLALTGDGREVVIFNLLVRDRLRSLLRGETTICTKFEL